MSVCVCACVGQKLLKNALSGVARAFKDVIFNEKQPTESIGMFLYLTQVKPVLFNVISATSYHRFLGSTPFKKRHVVFTISNSTMYYAHTKIQVYAEQEPITREGASN